MNGTMPATVKAVSRENRDPRPHLTALPFAISIRFMYNSFR